ncbi:MAG: SpoIIE family protein phosphatase [Bacteroidetes bacterium]|nr:SpoIIE family protein phosphatase [Bacteroidota bacterium]
MKKLCILFFILLSALCFGQSKSTPALTIDSLKLVVKSTNNPLEKLKTLNVLSEQLWLKADYTGARTYINQALKIEEDELKKEKNKDYLKEKAYTYNNIAIIYRFLGDYSLSLENHLIALKIREEIDDKRGLARSYLGIASIYSLIGKNEVSLQYNLKAKKLFEDVKDTLFTAYTCSHIADNYFESNNFKEAESYNSKAMLFFSQTFNLIGVSDCLSLAGYIYEKQANYKDALENFRSSLVICLMYKFKDRVISSYIDIARLYITTNQIKNARQCIDSALILTKQTGAKIQYKEIYYLKYKMDSVSKKLNSAIENLKLYYNYKDSLVNQKSSEEITQIQSRFESEKLEKIKQLEEERKEQLRKEREQKQEMIIYIISIGLFFMGLLSLFIFRSYRLKQKVNKELYSKNEVIENQKRLVEEKHKEITDSINYAERIQRSFLATKEMLDCNLNQSVTSSAVENYFVFFKPKDVVSGDFYWAANIVSSSGVESFAIATADSTGHGVPGAVMSLLNITSLEKAIETQTQPHDILNTTRKIIIERLKKDGSEEGGKDGMDCSLLVFDFANMKLQIAAANNPVWIVRTVTSSGAESSVTSSEPPLSVTSSEVEKQTEKGLDSARPDNTKEIIEIKPDKMPVGKHDKQDIPFTLHEINLQKGDVIYTLTDGFSDQFGGEKGKKFMSKNLRELLAHNSHLPMQEQKELLEKTFAKWKGDTEQVDDVTVIGIRI